VHEVVLPWPPPRQASATAWFKLRARLKIERAA